MYMLVNILGGQTDLSHFSFRQGFSLNLELINFGGTDKSMWSKHLLISLFSLLSVLRAGGIDYATIHSFYVGAEDTNSSSHAYVSGTLPT